MPKKRRGSKETSLFLRLPPHLVRQILLNPVRPIRLSNLTVCKALLPHALAALYNHVDIRDHDLFLSFADTVEKHPGLLKLIRSCFFGPVTTMYGDSSPSRTNAAKPPKKTEHTSIPLELSYSFTHRLASLLHKMTNLDHLGCAGSLASRVLFDKPHDFLASCWPKLRSVALYTVVGEGWCSWSDVDIYPSVMSLRTLRDFRHDAISGTLAPMPSLHLLPPTYIPPRSSNLESLSLSCLQSSLEPEVRILFAACSDALRNVRLCSIAVSASLPTDFRLLPSSLRTLYLQVGCLCPVGSDEGAASSVPSFEDSLVFFPLLEEISLLGNLIDDISALSSLPHLTKIALGGHVAYSSSSLTHLLPPTLPALKHLDLSLCTCAADQSPIAGRALSFAELALNSPTVKPARLDGEVLLREAARAGVTIEGNWRCAMGMCTTTPAHRKLCIGGGL